MQRTDLTISLARANPGRELWNSGGLETDFQKRVTKTIGG